MEAPMARPVFGLRVYNLNLMQGPSIKVASCESHDAEENQSERIRDPLRTVFGPQLQFLGDQALLAEAEARATRLRH
jgi:hypothetical protein